MKKCRSIILMCVIVLGACCLANAATHSYVVQPVLYGSTNTDVLTAGMQCADGYVGTFINWSYNGSPHDWTAWAKYYIPTFPSGQSIIAVYLNINVLQQYDINWGEGVAVYRVDDDSWTDLTITNNWVVSSDYTYNRIPYDPPAMPSYATGLVSSDITTWLGVSGEGQGQMLSVRLSRISGGARGVMLAVPTLTIVTQDSARANNAWSAGHDILMKKGLQIQAQVFPDPANWSTARWVESNFTTLNFQWGADPNIMEPVSDFQWGRWAGDTGLTDYELAYYDKMVSFQYGDEQNLNQQSQRDVAAGALAAWRNSYPEVLGFTNQYKDQVTTANMLLYMQQAKPDMVVFDNYPFTSSIADSLTTWYTEVQRYRLLGLTGCDSNNIPIPYGLYLQTYYINGHAPSDSEMRLNQFAAWAFGYKFVSAFLYNSLPAYDLTSSLFSGTGTSTPLPAFYQLAETNRQSLNLGESLTRLVSTDIRMIANNHSLPSNITAWDSSAGSYITSITASNPGSVNGGNPGDVLVGYFKAIDESFDGDASNQIYFMIVNGLTSPTASAAAATQTIQIDFDFGMSGISSLQRLSRDTGAVEVVSLISLGGTAYRLNLSLPGGTGDLFKFNTGAHFINGPYGCGQPGTYYKLSDISGSGGFSDCYVDEFDLKVMAEEWLNESAIAAEYVITPSLEGNTGEGSTGYLDTYAKVGLYYTPAVERTTWLKYNIPIYSGELISKVTIDIQPTFQAGGYNQCDLYVTYVSDDSWTSDTIHSDWPAVESTRVVNRPYLSGWDNPLISNDITSWVSSSGEGQGQTLSIRIDRNDTGARGCLMNPAPTLTISTIPMLLTTMNSDISGDAGVPDEVVDLYDFAKIASEWLQCTDPINENCD